MLFDIWWLDGSQWRAELQSQTWLPPQGLRKETADYSFSAAHCTHCRQSIMYTRDRVSAFSPLGVRYAVGHYSFMIWPVIISTMEVVCGNKDRSRHMRAREAQAQERGREMEQIYGAWYSHFARSCYTFWARGFPDMIEFECTLPYTKVSACCVNISCKHFVSIRGPLYRPIEETTRLIVHLR